jgi:ketosteroid isomerase-like protein
MRFFLNLLLMLAACSCYSQVSDTTEIKIVVDSINREVDRAVVQKNIAYMLKHYANDFKFTHGTGSIDNKESWIGKAQVAKTQYLSRDHYSTNVEVHGDIAIVTGTLKVVLPAGGNRSGYGLHYARVYRLNKNVWQMVSHRTFAQWDLKE